MLGNEVIQSSYFEICIVDCDAIKCESIQPPLRSSFPRLTQQPLLLFVQFFFQIIVVALLITGCYSADDNAKTIGVNITKTDAISNETVSTTLKLPSMSTTTTSTTESFPLLEDLVSAERANNADNDGSHDDDEKNTAKRTIDDKFSGPIVVNEEVNLFTPVDEFSRKQRINVQIIDPERHNNGQFLKQTVFQRQENSTVITSKTTTTSTTERPGRHKNIVVEQKFSAPIQVVKQRQSDEDCDDPPTKRPIVVSERPNRPIVVTERQNRLLENVDIQKKTEVIYKDEPKPALVFGARVTSTVRPKPCDQPCSTPRPYRPSSTPRLKPFNTTPLPAPRIYTTPRVLTAPVVSTPIVASTPRVLTTPPTLITSTVTPVPVPYKPIAYTSTVTPIPYKPIATIVPVTEKPVYIHTHSEVPVVQKEYVQLPPKIIDRPVIHKEIVQSPPQVHVVEKPRVVIQKEFIHLPPQEKIVPVEVEKLVVKEVPINNVIEKHIEHPPQVLEKLVPYPVPSKPIEVEKIVQVPVDRVVEKQVPVCAVFFSLINFLVLNFQLLFVKEISLLLFFLFFFLF